MNVPKVLIIDTADSVAEFYSDFMKLRDYSASAVHDTAAALRTIQATPPDLIIGDMPAFSDGSKIADLAAGLNIPIIYASRFKDFEYENLPKFARVINKPFNGLDLKFSARAQLVKHAARNAPGVS